MISEHKSVFKFFKLTHYAPQNNKKLNNSRASDIQIGVTREQNLDRIRVTLYPNPRHPWSKLTSPNPKLWTNFASPVNQNLFQIGVTPDWKLIPNTRHTGMAQNWVQINVTQAIFSLKAQLSVDTW